MKKSGKVGANDKNRTRDTSEGEGFEINVPETG